jgi:hypothetical protein
VEEKVKRVKKVSHLAWKIKGRASLCGTKEVGWIHVSSVRGRKSIDNVLCLSSRFAKKLMSPMQLCFWKIRSPHFPCAAVRFMGLGCLPQCDSCAEDFFLGSGINVLLHELYIM